MLMLNKNVEYGGQGQGQDDMGQTDMYSIFWSGKWINTFGP